MLQNFPDECRGKAKSLCTKIELWTREAYAGTPPGFMSEQESIEQIAIILRKKMKIDQAINYFNKFNVPEHRVFELVRVVYLKTVLAIHREGDDPWTRTL